MNKKDREELINHWADIACTVFRAEDNIKRKWKPILEANQKAEPEVAQRIAREFLRAIAIEIVTTAEMMEKAQHSVKN